MHIAHATHAKLTVTLEPLKAMVLTAELLISEAQAAGRKSAAMRGNGCQAVRCKRQPLVSKVVRQCYVYVGNMGLMGQSEHMQRVPS
jgi:hypothetical protein